jgi:hypothetical protein
MLNLTKVQQALEAKSSIIKLSEAERLKSFKLIAEGLQRLAKTKFSEFNEKVLSSQESFTGALATEELSAGIIHNPLDAVLSCREEVNKWKEKILKNRITTAVDGSQIEPDKNLGLFFGAVQVGWFVNYHSEGKPPIKDIDFEIVLPELMSEEDYELKHEISLRRFEKEALTLAKLIKQIAKTTYDKRPVVFFDGSLTLGFITSERRRKDYQAAMNHLLEASKSCQIPVVGFVDTSMAYGLVKSIEYAFQLPAMGSRISDTALLASQLEAWGSRSAVFKYHEVNSSTAAGSNEICFCYLKTSTHKAKPARLEMPNWVYEQGLTNEVVSVVLAECLVGNGYPYAIEVADSIAVLQAKEREAFFEYLDKKEFFSFSSLASWNTGLAKSSKLQSKLNRRKPTIMV